MFYIVLFFHKYQSSLLVFFFYFLFHYYLPPFGAKLFFILLLALLLSRGEGVSNTIFLCLFLDFARLKLSVYACFCVYVFWQFYIFWRNGIWVTCWWCCYCCCCWFSSTSRFVFSFSCFDFKVFWKLQKTELFLLYFFGCFLIFSSIINSITTTHRD